MAVRAELRGAGELRRIINARKLAVQSEALAVIVREAAEIMRVEWAALAHVGPERTDAQAHPHYRDTIHVEDEQLLPWQVSCLVKSGVTLRPYDVWVEFGTVHNRSFPSMRPAFDVTRVPMAEQIKAAILDRLERVS